MQEIVGRMRPDPRKLKTIRSHALRLEECFETMEDWRLDPRPRMQLRSSGAEYARKKCIIRRNRARALVEQVTPWKRLISVIEPFYPKGGGYWRLTIGLEKVLPLYIVQQGLCLRGDATDDGLKDSQAIQQLVGMNPSRGLASDVTSRLKFCRLLMEHRLTATVIRKVKQHLAAGGLAVEVGPVSNMTVSVASSPTKNHRSNLDPEVRQAKTATTMHRGVKPYISVNAAPRRINTLETTPAGAADQNLKARLSLEKLKVNFGGAGYQVVKKREDNKDVEVNLQAAMRPGKRRLLPDTPMARSRERREHLRIGACGGVQHPLHIAKKFFGVERVPISESCKQGRAFFCTPPQA
jgi:IS5 family transposase